ncbi:MAG: metal ABC transporter permease [Planctomycetes bacterium]|nr:metal ABC transporter permease [Planctomycetota bacterium]
MNDFVAAMALPCLACLLLTGIHVRLGLQVIAREVVFADLALAQVAALGALYAVWLGYDLFDDPWVVKATSLAFTTGGAVLLTVTRPRGSRIPHEAIIGTIYTVALAATIVASAHLPHGAEHIGSLLSGSILWVRPDTVGWTAVLYALVGLIHFVFRRPLAEITHSPESAAAMGRRVWLWDLLFYATFGVVVTSSVSIAGVLVVYAYLIVPAVIALLCSPTPGPQLGIGWAVGAIVSIVGCAVSYTADLPAGPTIVVTFGATLVLAGLARAAIPGPHRHRSASGLVIATTAVLAALAIPWWAFGEKGDGSHSHSEAPGASVTEAIRTRIERAVASDDEWAASRDRLSEWLREDDPDIFDAAIALARSRRDPETVPVLRDRATEETDLFRRIELAGVLHDLDADFADRTLIEIVLGDAPIAARREALRRLKEHRELDGIADAARLAPAEIERLRALERKLKE